MCAWQGACVAGGCAWQGAYMVVEGACVAGWGMCVAREMATAADGTHPTRMLSCFIFLFRLCAIVEQCYFHFSQM